MASGGGLREPLAFGLLFGSLGVMFGLFWQFLMMKNNMLSLFGSLFGEFGLSITFLGTIILSPLFVTIILIAISGILHLCLLMVRGGKNGFEGTFRVVAYSQATQIFTFVPFVGGLVGWFRRPLRADDHGASETTDKAGGDSGAPAARLHDPVPRHSAVEVRGPGDAPLAVGI